MTTLREAAQMALDALEQITGKAEAMSYYCSFAVEIESLRAALAQPEQEPYCYTWDKWISGGNWQAQYGWEPYCGGKRPDHSTEAKPLYTAPPQREWCQCKDAPNDCTYENNCRVPQIDAAFKRIEWQGLTDEELSPIYAEYKSPRNIYLAIESALREKNT